MPLIAKKWEKMKITDNSVNKYLDNHLMDLNMQHEKNLQGTSWLDLFCLTMLHTHYFYMGSVVFSMACALVLSKINFSCG